jgi:quinoprotein glucose dehydrogenase
MNMTRKTRKWAWWLVAVAGLALAAFLAGYDIAALPGLASIGSALDKVQEKCRDEGVAGVWRALREKAAGPAQVFDPSLRYSLYDKASQPPLEDVQARNALPEYKSVAAAAVDALPPSLDDGRRYDSWSRSNGDERSSKFSSLSQLTRANVAQLVPAWTYASGADLGNPAEPGVNVQTNPVFAHGRLFVTSVDGHVISLDAATGREIWRLKLPEPVAKRGMVWQPHADFEKSRLFVPAGDGVYAVLAQSGQIIKSFGKDGRVGSQLSLIAPVIVKDKLILANVKPALEAYDLQTGQWRWSRSLLIRPAVEGAYLFGGVPWGGMSADSARSTVYVSTGNPRPELIGTSRPGDNRHSCSVVAIDADSGEIRWDFQIVTHDLWDLDIPAAPVLTTISRQGRKVDVLAAVTKTGNTIVLDRDSGKPIFDYRLRRAPVSAIPGEKTASHQPEFVLPEPFAKQQFDLSDVTDVSEAARQTVLRKIKGARHGFFEPPVMGGKVVLYGLHGGAEWPGAAVDQATGVLYVPSNELPWLIRANYMDIRATAETGAAGAGQRPVPGQVCVLPQAGSFGLVPERAQGRRLFPGADRHHDSAQPPSTGVAPGIRCNPCPPAPARVGDRRGIGDPVWLLRRAGPDQRQGQDLCLPGDVAVAA